MPTPTRIKTVVPTATKPTPPTPPTPAAPKPPLRDRLARLLPGFNVNSVLLFIVITLLAVVVFKPEPSIPEYRYQATRVSNFSLSYAEEKRDKELSELNGYKVIDKSANWPDLLYGGYPKDTEYVGTLCKDGEDGVWVIVRWRKK